MPVQIEEIQKMRDARRHALLAKWSTGARLSPDERDEIGDLIGARSSVPVAEVPPSSSPAGSPLAPPLVLESPPAQGFSSRSGCRHPLIPGTPYELTYAVTVRQIKRWRAAGAQHHPPAYPPLDEPHRMAAWYRSVMQRRVPARLVELEEAAPPPAAPAAVARAVIEPLPAGAEPPAGQIRVPAAAPPLGLSTGYAATLDRLRQAEAIAAQRYTEAVASADPEVRAQAAALKREWMDLADTVRAYERDRGKVLREADEIWDRQAVLEAIASVHNVIAPGVRRLWRTIRRRHAQFHELTSTQQDEVFAAEADALFGVLINSHFTASALPSPEPPAPLDPRSSVSVSALDAA